MSEPKMIRRRSEEPWLSSYLNSKGCALGIPVSGNFELTSRCNFNCKMCYVHSQDDQKKLIHQELTADQWLSIASDARDAGMLFLLLTGGEPFIRKDFAQIYEELIKMGMMVSINTNASLYNEELRELFRKYPPTRINVSLYGGSEETYQSLCGNASFEKVVNNLRSMKEDHLSVRLNVSLTPYNVSDMAMINDISKELNLHVKATSYMYPPVRVDGKIGSNQARFSAEKAGKVMANWDFIRETDEQFKFRKEKMCWSEAPYELKEPEGVSCRAGRSSFWLTWDGNMLPCGMMSTLSVNTLELGFLKAWEEIRQMTQEIRLPAECAGCANRANCGICAAISKSETGEFGIKPEYVCAFTKARCLETTKLATTI